MNVSAPRIGFDRFIHLDWATAALKVRAGVAQREDLEALLDAAGLGAAAGYVMYCSITCANASTMPLRTCLAGSE